MTLHIPTLMLTVTLGFALLALSVTLAYGGLRRQPELRHWIVGSWFMLGGSALLTLRPWIPFNLSLVGAIWAHWIGIALYGHALHRFIHGRGLPRALIIVATLGCLSLLAMLDWSAARRTVGISVVYVSLLAPLVLPIWRQAGRGNVSLQVVGWTLALASAALAVRGGHAYLYPELYGDARQSNLGQGLTHLTAFLALLGAGFGFVLASFERLASRMEEMARHDGLTGCINRATADALVDHALQLGRRDGAPVAFVLLDIDHFKQVNDRLGHRAGDCVLRAFADAVRARLRASDVFGRYGGEEFGVALPATDQPGALRVAEALRVAVEALDIELPDGNRTRVTVSAGVAVASSDSQVTADQLFGRADHALYDAKRNGRNRVEAFVSAQ